MSDCMRSKQCTLPAEQATLLDIWGAGCHNSTMPQQLHGTDVAVTTSQEPSSTATAACRKACGPCRPHSPLLASVGRQLPVSAARAAPAPAAACAVAPAATGVPPVPHAAAAHTGPRAQSAPTCAPARGTRVDPADQAMGSGAFLLQLPLTSKATSCLQIHHE